MILKLMKKIISKLSGKKIEFAYLQKDCQIMAKCFFSSKADSPKSTEVFHL